MKTPTARLVLGWLPWLMWVVSCGTGLTAPAADPTAPFRAPFSIASPSPTTAIPTPFQPATSTPTLPLPSATPSPSPFPTASPTPDLSSSPIPATVTVPFTLPTSPADRPLYQLYVTIDYDAHHLWVDQAISYPNLTGVSLSDLVLIVEPDRFPDVFTLNELWLHEAGPAAIRLDSGRLLLSLPAPLLPGETLHLGMRYELNLPARQEDTIFGWLSDQINLSDWYPFVAPYDPSQGWLAHDPMPWGEHLVYDWAEYDLYVRFTDPATAPLVAAPALAEASGEWTRYHLSGARSVALSMSRRFQVYETAVRSTIVRSYYFPEHRLAGEKIGYVASQVLGLFDPLLAPYPYPILNVVETSYRDGQEFDALAFLSSDFYDTYNGTSKSNLVVIGVHEMAHNWWFGLVGNDPALEPWLDEALCVYSERLFFEHTNPGLVDWWWRFRLSHFTPTGWVDTTIYEAPTFLDYVSAVYFNGAQFLDQLRTRMGTTAFQSFLKDYARQNAYRRSTTEAFLDLARQHTRGDVQDLIRAYFRQAK